MIFQLQQNVKFTKKKQQQRFAVIGQVFCATIHDTGHVSSPANLSHFINTHLPNFFVFRPYLLCKKTERQKHVYQFYVCCTKFTVAVVHFRDTPSGKYLPRLHFSIPSTKTIETGVIFFLPRSLLHKIMPSFFNKKQQPRRKSLVS